jgi:hypothetical protein
MPEEFILLTQDPDWSEGLEERHEYLTDILTGYTSAEQRVQLRSLPRLALNYRLLLATAAEASALEADLWRLRALRVQLPLWTDGAPLLDDAAPLDESLTFDRATRRFAAGGLALLWRDAATCELVNVESVDVGGLTLAEPLAGTWPADGRTRVLPVLVGRLEDAPQVIRSTSQLASLALQFLSEPFPGREGSGPSTYQGFDVLEEEPDAGTDRTVTYTRSLHVLDGQTGLRAAWDRVGTPLVGRQPLTLLLEGREEIEAMQIFLARRCGRLSPFWQPTWARDLQIYANLASGDPDLVIMACSYADGLFSDPARRHLTFILPDGTPYYREVMDAAPGAPGTEVLTLDTSRPVTLDKDSMLISFLTLCRLAADDPTLHWHSDQVAETTLETVEIPFEAELLEVGS